MNHSILIVEDDNVIRQGLAKSIRNLRLPIGEIRSAANGREALAMCHAHLPDIAITDVRMPGMNGLTFIQHARDLGGACQFIILSGFDEFSYAKRAIGLGVLDYLLKPVNLATLSSVLRSAIDRNETDAADRDRGKLEARALRSTLDSVLTAVLRGILDRTHRADEAARLLDTFPQETEDPLLFLLLCRGSPDMDTPQHTAADVALRRFLGEHFAVRFSYRNRYDEVAYLAALDQGQVADLEDFYRRLGRLLDDPGNDFFDGMHVGASSCQPSLRSVPLLAEQAFEALDRRILEPAGRLFRFAPVSPGESRPTTRLRDCGKLAISIRQGRRGDIDRALENLWGELRMGRAASLRQLKECLHAALFSVFKNLVDDPNECFSPHEIETLFRDSDSLECLHRRLRAQILSIRRSGGEAADDAMDAIDRAVQYIDRHFDQDLDLGTVARASGVSPNWLCTRFRKKTGEGFVRHLQRVRIDRAKRLLADGHRRIADVAAAVGFQEDKYFHRVFKEITGLTATQFRAGIRERRLTGCGEPAPAPRSR